MVFDITHLKKIRKQLNLTQHQFAQLAGISQSLVAKIEAGKLDPTYSYVKKIEEAIALLTQQQEPEKCCKEAMHKGVISISSRQKLTDVLPLFTKHGISQIPVIEQEKVIGLLSESVIINQIGKHLAQKQVYEVMEDAPPVISAETNLQMVISLLSFAPLLIVQAKGELIGVITKADILKQLQNRQ